MSQGIQIPIVKWQLESLFWPPDQNAWPFLNDFQISQDLFPLFGGVWLMRGTYRPRSAFCCGKLLNIFCCLRNCVWSHHYQGFGFLLTSGRSDTSISGLNTSPRPHKAGSITFSAAVQNKHLWELQLIYGKYMKNIYENMRKIHKIYRKYVEICETNT